MRKGLKGKWKVRKGDSVYKEERDWSAFKSSSHQRICLVGLIELRELERCREIPGTRGARSVCIPLSLLWHGILLRVSSHVK